MVFTDAIEDREFYKFVEIDNDTYVKTSTISGFNIPSYDTTELGYTDGNLTSVVYKKDGSTVATLTLTYTDGNLTGVVRT